MDLGQVSLLFVAFVFALYVLVLLALRFGLGLGYGTVALWGLLQLCFLGSAGVLAGTGYLVSDVTAMPPLIVRLVVLPAFLVVVVVASLPATGRVLDGAKADYLVSLQAFRVPLELILYGLFLSEAAPKRLTFAGQNFDIVTGVLALLVGYLMHKGRAPRGLIAAFNAVGLVLLAVIVTLALLSAPTPLQVFADTPELRVPFHVPFVWLPGYVVPVALLLHLLSLRKLVRDGAAAGA